MDAISRVATGQFGVIGREQLQMLGLTPGEIRALVERGFLIPLHRAVFAVGHRSIIPHGHLFAALLASGDEALLTHRSSAAARGLRAINTHEIHLTAPGRKRRSRDNLIIHNTGKIDPSEITTYNGLRVSSVPRMLLEIAPGETPDELDRIITECVRRNLLDLGEMDHTLHRHAGRPGIVPLTKALRAYRKSDTTSRLEHEFARELAKRPEVPCPDRNVHLGPWEIDFYWPAHQLAIELDGRPYHVAVKDMERDRHKDTWLQRRRTNSIRITDLRWTHDRAGVWEDVYAFLGISPTS